MLIGPLLLPPLFLAGPLALSGAAKVRHAEATRSAFAQLRMPPTLTTSAAPRALPWAEFLLALALVLAPPPLALPVAVLAPILCLGYLAVIVRALGFDHPVTCGCFGELGVGEVTGRTAVRNALLVLLAALTLWSASAEASPAVRLLAAPATTWAWLAVTVLSGAILLTTFGEAKGGPRPVTGAGGVDPEATHEGELLEYARQPLPFAALVEADGRTRTLRDLAAHGAVLLVFVSAGCSPCAEAISAIADWDASLAPVRVRAVVAQDLESAVATAPGLTGPVLHDPHGATARVFGLGTPGAVLLGADGLLAGGSVHGRAGVAAFVADVRRTARRGRPQWWSVSDQASSSSSSVHSCAAGPVPIGSCA